VLFRSEQSGGINVLYYFSKILDENGKNIRIYCPECIKNNHEKGVPKRGTLNIIKAKKLLNFRPKHDLELGIKKYISYLLNK
jgi:nucleoside-diphosphate-sugar epimerase